jgi:hypothetical protein
MLNPRKVLLVDDHELVRIGVRTTYPELRGVPIEWFEATTPPAAPCGNSAGRSRLVAQALTDSWRRLSR